MSSPGNRRLRKDTDRISILPDTVLCLVLSFLSTKSVVKTSIFSKRWRYIWMKVPVLDFTDTDKPDYYKYRQLSLEQTICFKSFVDKVLLHNNVSYVQRFCLNLHDVDEIYVNSWLTAAASRKIHELSISIYRNRTSRVHISLPPGLLSGEKLRVMKLNGRLILSTLMFAHLPNLETIELWDLKFPDDGFMKRLLSSCLVLKELYIIECDGMPENLYIESSTLKSLAMWCRDARTCFDVKTPNLRYLTLHGTLSEFNIGDMCSLIEADLDVIFEDDVDCQAQQLLGKVSWVKSLQLRHDFLQENTSYITKLPLFQNLTFSKQEADAVMCELLQSAPKLKSLVLLDVNYDNAFDPEFAPKHLPCLETVKIVLSYDEDEEVSLVAYFLKAASALKEMEIKITRDVEIKFTPSSPESEIDFYKKLLSLPRSSAVCQIKVV